MPLKQRKSVGNTEWQELCLTIAPLCFSIKTMAVIFRELFMNQALC